MADALLSSAMLHTQPNEEPLFRLPLARLAEHRGQAEQHQPVQARRAAIYAYIVSCVMEHGRAPTIRQIGEAFGMSSTGHVVYYVDRLYAQGLIMQRKTCRSITVCGFRDWPVLGTVVHGVPRSYLRVLEDQRLLASTPYVFVVADNALVSLHYCAGDSLIVEPASLARQVGQVVVARWMEPERNAAFFLAKVCDDGQLANLATQPPVAQHELSRACVQGVVTGVVRLCKTLLNGKAGIDV